MGLSGALFLLGGYLLGSVPFGLVVCRLIGAGDPRLGGSGNIGATNVARLAGKPAGIATLFLDVAKGAVPVYLAMEYQPFWAASLVGLAAFLGHIYPVYLRFKGGKGVATAMGVYLALAPLALTGILAVFILAAWISGHVSLASMLSCGSAPLWMLGLGTALPAVLTATLMALVVVWRHKDNIVRLRTGQEQGLR